MGRAHMGRHIVGAFFYVLEQRVTIGHQSLHKSLEVPQHLRISVLAHQQRGTGVTDPDRADADPHSAGTHQRRKFSGQFDKTTRARSDGQFMGENQD